MYNLWTGVDNSVLLECSHKKRKEGMKERRKREREKEKVNI